MVTQIADISIGLSQINVRQSLGVNLLKKALDTASGNAEELVQMMTEPHMGANIDISVQFQLLKKRFTQNVERFFDFYFILGKYCKKERVL